MFIAQSVNSGKADVVAAALIFEPRISKSDYHHFVNCAGKFFLNSKQNFITEIILSHPADLFKFRLTKVAVCDRIIKENNSFRRVYKWRELKL